MPSRAVRVCSCARRPCSARRHAGGSATLYGHCSRHAARGPVSAGVAGAGPPPKVAASNWCPHRGTAHVFRGEERGVPRTPPRCTLSMTPRSPRLRAGSQPTKQPLRAEKTATGRLSPSTRTCSFRRPRSVRMQWMYRPQAAFGHRQGRVVCLVGSKSRCGVVPRVYAGRAVVLCTRYSTVVPPLPCERVV